MGAPTSKTAPSYAALAQGSLTPGEQKGRDRPRSSETPTLRKGQQTLSAASCRAEQASRQERGDCGKGGPTPQHSLLETPETARPRVYVTGAKRRLCHPPPGPAGSVPKGGRAAACAYTRPPVCPQL